MRPGLDDSANADGRFTTGVTTRLFPAPSPWRTCPPPGAKPAPQGQNYYYLIAKYEVTNLQWHAVMDASCPDSQNLPADAARP